MPRPHVDHVALWIPDRGTFDGDLNHIRGIGGDPNPCTFRVCACTLIENEAFKSISDRARVGEHGRETTDISIRIFVNLYTEDGPLCGCGIRGDDEPVSFAIAVGIEFEGVFIGDDIRTVQCVELYRAIDPGFILMNDCVHDIEAREIHIHAFGIERAFELTIGETITTGDRLAQGRDLIACMSVHGFGKAHRNHIVLRDRRGWHFFFDFFSCDRCRLCSNRLFSNGLLNHRVFAQPGQSTTCLQQHDRDN